MHASSVPLQTANVPAALLQPEGINDPTQAAREWGEPWGGRGYGLNGAGLIGFDQDGIGESGTEFVVSDQEAMETAAAQYLDSEVDDGPRPGNRDWRASNCLVEPRESTAAPEPAVMQFAKGAGEQPERHSRRKGRPGVPRNFMVDRECTNGIGDAGVECDLDCELLDDASSGMSGSLESDARSTHLSGWT